MKKLLFVLILIFGFIYVLVNNFTTAHETSTGYFNNYLVFEPDIYDSTNEYPLLFMLHGYSGDYKQWSEIVDLQNYANQCKFIIVCPDGHYDSWYVDSPILKESQFETYFFNTLVPDIFNKYNIDTTNVFITGLSMGGHGAINLFLDHPGFFKSAGSTSGILDILPFPDKWGIKNVLGDQKNNFENWIKHSAIYNLDKITDLNKSIIVDCGTEDFAFDVNKRFRDSCTVHGIDLTFIQSHGNHSREYWAKSIIKHFEFFRRIVEDQKDRTIE